MKPTFKAFTLTFKTGKSHCSQQITINTISKEIALQMAKKEIANAYGSDILKDTFFID
jgi:hypothetical protein